MFELLDEKEEAADLPDAKPLEVQHGQVDIAHVDFGYDEGRLILRDVNLVAPCGRITQTV